MSKKRCRKKKKSRKPNVSVQRNSSKKALQPEDFTLNPWGNRLGVLFFACFIVLTVSYFYLAKTEILHLDIFYLVLLGVVLLMLRFIYSFMCMFILANFKGFPDFMQAWLVRLIVSPKKWVKHSVVFGLIFTIVLMLVEVVFYKNISGVNLPLFLEVFLRNWLAFCIIIFGFFTVINYADLAKTICALFFLVRRGKVTRKIFQRP